MENDEKFDWMQPNVRNEESLLAVLQAGAPESPPELLSVDREINVIQSCVLSKHFVS